MGEGFEITDGSGDAVELHANVSDRERRRYISQLRVVSQAAELAAAGFDERNDQKAIAGTVGVAMIWDQIGSELREVIEETLETAARDFASKLAPIDIDAVEIPDSIEGLDDLFAGIEADVNRNTDEEEN